MPKLSIIICVYNEAASALPVIEKVRAVRLSEGWSKEIIVVVRSSYCGLDAGDMRVEPHA